MLWALLRAHFNPSLAIRAKTESQSGVRPGSYITFLPCRIQFNFKVRQKCDCQFKRRACVALSSRLASGKCFKRRVFEDTERRRTHKGLYFREKLSANGTRGQKCSSMFSSMTLFYVKRHSLWFIAELRRPFGPPPSGAP